jgi:hypothetical protein
MCVILDFSNTNKVTRCFQDFSKSQHMRHFVQDYIRALYSQNAGEVVIQKFVSR